MAGAPDVTEPIVGYRAWRAAADGRLEPWSAYLAGSWEPGVNTARCLARPGVRGHVAPMRRCSCGIYALGDLRDPRLNARGQAVGAIVAWGDVELHATGFRAQHALIVALALPDACELEQARRLGLAAARYGVPLVPLEVLPAAAGEHGRAIGSPASLDRAGARTGTGGVPALADTGARGIAADEHLTVEVAAGGVRLAPTSALAAQVTGAVEPLVERGMPVQRGDALLRAESVTGNLVLPSPLSGLAAEAGDSGALALAPSAWGSEAAAIRWGPGADAAYAHELAVAARRGDPFTRCRAHWLRAHAGVRTAADVVASLRAARAERRFETTAQAEGRIAERLRRALADPALARRVGRLPLRIRWRLHSPEAELLIDLCGERPLVVTGECAARADIALFAAAETADRYFAGRVDLPAALRRREIQASATLATVLRADSVLKALKPAYAALERAGESSAWQSLS